MLLTSIIFIITINFKDVLANQDVVEQCCEQGKSQVTNGGCGNFSVPIDNVDSEHQNLCIATMEICCLTAERSESCSQGQKSAKSVTTKVLLVTAHRSGSTFLGELFNNNNDAFYVFEPLGAIQV